MANVSAGTVAKWLINIITRRSPDNDLIDKLARLNLIQYDQQQASAAERLGGKRGARAVTLDEVVARRREELELSISQFDSPKRIASLQQLICAGCRPTAFLRFIVVGGSSNGFNKSADVVELHVVTCPYCWDARSSESSCRASPTLTAVRW